MNSQHLAFAFAAGMAAAINPCGFAMLPAYLAFFLGLTDDVPADRRSESVGQALGRAVTVSLALTLGFVVVFGTIGAIWTSISSVVGGLLPWITAVMGIGLAGLGIAMLAGFDPVVRLPKFQVGNGGQEFGSMFLFGISYGVASLGCTLPIFLAVTSGTFTDGFTNGFSIFVAYALGMGALIAVVTIAVALAREGIVTRIKRLLPYMGRISGGLLLAAGVIVAYSGFAEAQQLAGRTTGTALFERMQDLQSNAVVWISDIGALRIGLIAAVIVAAAVGVSFATKGRRRPSSDDSREDALAPPADETTTPPAEPAKL